MLTTEIRGLSAIGVQRSPEEDCAIEIGLIQNSRARGQRRRPTVCTHGSLSCELARKDTYYKRANEDQDPVNASTLYSSFIHSDIVDTPSWNREAQKTPSIFCYNVLTRNQHLWMEVDLSDRTKNTCFRPKNKFGECH